MILLKIGICENIGLRLQSIGSVRLVFAIGFICGVSLSVLCWIFIVPASDATL